MEPRATSPSLLRGARVARPDGTAAQVDVRIRDGSIEEIGALIPQPDEAVVDLDGYLLLPSAIEPHAHLDKAFLAERIVNPTGDLLGAIRAMQANRHLLDVPETVERAERAAWMMAANGYRTIRTHADTAVDHGLRSIEALTEVRARVADVVDIQVVALCGWPALGAAVADQRALLRDAMAAGADLVGGCPHLEGEAGTRAATEFFLQVATDFGVGVDLHTDETLDPSVLGLVDLVEAVEAGFPHPATASHCVSLSMLPAERQHEIAERVAAAGVGIVALPHTNLFLQGRGTYPMPRALTAVAALRAAGARVAAGADNIQDPFNPVGRLDPFETAGLMIMTSHLLPHEAWETVTSESAAVVGCGPARIRPGTAADLLAVPAATVREAIAFAPGNRIVWRRGRRLAPDGTQGAVP